jgi:hypothetical protein
MALFTADLSLQDLLPLRPIVQRLFRAAHTVQPPMPDSLVLAFPLFHDWARRQPNPIAQRFIAAVGRCEQLGPEQTIGTATSIAAAKELRESFAAAVTFYDQGTK